MGILRARVGAGWEDILGGAAINEVFIGPDAPTDPLVELWYDTDDPGVSPANFAQIETGPYTPTLGVMAIGTGGSAQNTASYTFVGGVGVGARGILQAHGGIVFGTTSPVFPAAGAETISLPPGFNSVGLNNIHVLGTCTMQIASRNYFGTVWNQGATALRPVAGVVVGTALNQSDLAAAVPDTWVAGNNIYWNVVLPAVRV